LLPFVFKLCVEEDARNKKLGLDILSSLSLEVGAEAITPLLEHLQPVFSQALCPPHPVPVRVACLKTVASIVPHVVEKEHRAQQQALQGLLPACFSVLHETLGTGDMAHAHQCLSSFVDIASTDAGFLRPHVDTLLSAAFGVAGASVDENVRHLGLELMVSFAEGKPVCHVLLRRLCMRVCTRAPCASPFSAVRMSPRLANAREMDAGRCAQGCEFCCHADARHVLDDRDLRRRRRVERQPG